MFQMVIACSVSTWNKQASQSISSSIPMFIHGRRFGRNIDHRFTLYHEQTCDQFNKNYTEKVQYTLYVYTIEYVHEGMYDLKKSRCFNDKLLISTLYGSILLWNFCVPVWSWYSGTRWLSWNPERNACAWCLKDRSSMIRFRCKIISTGSCCAQQRVWSKLVFVILYVHNLHNIFRL